MFKEDEVLNSIAYELEKVLKDNIPSKININNNANAVITVQRNAMTVSSIDSSNKYWILLLFPRISNLKFSSETYGSDKKFTYRCEIYVISQGDQYCYQLISKLQYFFAKNENLMTKFGLKKPKIEKEFLKVSDSKIFSGGLTGTFSAFGSNVYGEIYL